MLKKIIPFILCTIIIFSLYPKVPTEATESGDAYLVVQNVPKYGDIDTIRGIVEFESGKGSFENLSITIYLQIEEGGAFWVKPTFENPSVDVNSDGSWECRFITGGLDNQAKTLHVYLIPSDFVPSSDKEKTEGVCFDKAVITRTESGSADIVQHQRFPQEQQKIYAQQKNPNDTEKLSVCFSPYINNQNPETNTPVPEPQIKWQLNILYPYVDTIRTFGVTGELEKIYALAKNEYKYRIIAGTWFDKRYSESQIIKELDALIELANKGYVDIAVVGSEILFRGDFSEDELIKRIRYVKAGIKNKDIPVTTSESLGVLINHLKLISECDVILATDYPYFEKINIDNASKALFDAYEKLKSYCGSKQVILSETGWPTSGTPEGQAVPSMENAKKYFNAVYEWSKSENVEVIFFSSTDELWKKEGVNGDIGSNWGHTQANGIIKEAYIDIYTAIAPQPVTDAHLVKWAEDQILELVQKGIINPDDIALYNPRLKISRGDFLHYFMNTVLPSGNYDFEDNFSDIPQNIYYYNSIGQGKKMGLILGTGENKCAPDNFITREDLLVMMYRGLKYLKIDLPADYSALDKFKDKDKISPYAKEAVAALVKAGIVLGDTENKINPSSTASRAEAAVFLYRLYKSY